MGETYVLCLFEHLYDSNNWENAANLKTVKYSVKLKQLKFFVQYLWFQLLFIQNKDHIMIMTIEFAESVKHMHIC